jgi:hypothetical protein
MKKGKKEGSKGRRHGGREKLILRNSVAHFVPPYVRYTLYSHTNTHTHKHTHTHIYIYIYMTKGTVRAGDYTSFCEKESHQLGIGFFVHQGIVSAIKRIEFVNDKMSYMVLRGRWCNIIVLNVYAPTEEKSDGSEDSFYEKLEQVFDHFPEYHTKILLGDFIAKLGKEDTFKPKIGNESLCDDSNDNGVRVVNVATSKNLVVKSTMFPLRIIHKCTWTCPDGKTHNQIDHVLIDRR